MIFKFSKAGIGFPGVSMTLAKPAAPETRCACGRLLAKLTDAGVELKCARCGRVVLIDWSSVADERSRSPLDG
jgi:hypothetical protein